MTTRWHPGGCQLASGIRLDNRGGQSVKPLPRVRIPDKVAGMGFNRLTTFIVIGLVAGIAAGYLSHSAFPESSAAFSEGIALLPGAFLRLIKMIISPLVFATLVVGIAKMEDIRTVGRIGGKALGWFIFASVISLSLGLVIVGLFEPGKVMQLPIPAEDAAAAVGGEALSLKVLVSHAIPTSILDAMARNEILQIVVFSVFFGIAMAALGERTRPIVAALDTIAHIMLKVTGYVMLFAPFAVFGALASIVAKEGLGIVQLYGVMVGRVLHRHCDPVAGADCARRARDRAQGARARAQDPGARDPRVLDRKLGSRIPEDPR